MTAKDMTRKITLLSRMTVSNGCKVSEALNAARLLVQLYNKLVNVDPVIAKQCKVQVDEAKKFIASQNVKSEPKNNNIAMEDLKAMLDDILKSYYRLKQEEELLLKEEEHLVNMLNRISTKIDANNEKMKQVVAEIQSIEEAIDKAKSEQNETEDDIGTVDKITRAERAKKFNKIYEEIIASIIKKTGINVTKIVTDEMLKELQISRQYFMILFRNKAKNDKRIVIIATRKKGTFIYSA